MPWRLRKAPKRNLYWVIGQDGSHMSKDPIPLERAKAQIKALYASERQQKMKGGIIDRTTFETRRSRGVYPAGMSYEEFARISGESEAATQQSIANLQEAQAAYEADPSQHLVSCPYTPAGDVGKTTMSRAECEAARGEWERKNHPANYYFFRPAVNALTTAADIGASVLEDVPGVGKIASKVYQGFAPPGSAYYSDGSFGEKAVGTAASLFGLGMTGGREEDEETREMMRDSRERVDQLRADRYAAFLEAKRRGLGEAYGKLKEKVYEYAGRRMVYMKSISKVALTLPAEWRSEFVSEAIPQLEGEGISVVDDGTPSFSVLTHYEEEPTVGDGRFRRRRMRGGFRIPPGLMSFFTGSAIGGGALALLQEYAKSLGLGNNIAIAIGIAIGTGWLASRIEMSVRAGQMERAEAAQAIAEAERVADEHRREVEMVRREHPEIVVHNPDGTLAVGYAPEHIAVAIAPPARVQPAAREDVAIDVAPRVRMPPIPPRRAAAAAAAAAPAAEGERVVANPMYGQGRAAKRMLASIRAHGGRAPAGLVEVLEGGIKVHPVSPAEKWSKYFEDRLYRIATTGGNFAEAVRQLEEHLSRERPPRLSARQFVETVERARDRIVEWAAGDDDDESTVASEAEEELEGAGIFGDIWSGVKKYASRVVDVVRHGKRQDYPPQVRELLARIGNQPIVAARLRRDPIKAPLNIALNLITKGSWEQAKRKYAYDKLFHLGLEVTVRVSDTGNSNGNYVIEKNEVINVAPANPATPDTETLPVDVRSGATINSLLAGARKIQGANFFNYNAFTNNCQDFIIAVLNGSGLATPANTAWVKQPIEQVAAELPGYTSTVANLATDLGALANVVLHGRGGGRTPRSRFAKQLKAAGVSPEAYLMEAQQKAKNAGLAWEMLGFSDDDKHKLQIPNHNGTIVRFGAVGLGDHILYTLKGDPQADEHQRRYLSRATKIRGRWREDEYSPNSLAIAVLW